MPATRHTALVPLRALDAAKSRLALRLTPDQRAALARAMFRDVVAALAASQVDEVVVAVGDEDAASAARELGLRAHLDPPGTASLNAALAAAASTVRTATLLVVTADLPCLRPPEVDELLAAPSPVVIAPTHDGGTGGLLRRPPDAIATAYGPRSAQRHRELAADAALEAATVDAPGLRCDVDTWADVVGLKASQVGRSTARLLPELLAAA